MSSNQDADISGRLVAALGAHDSSIRLRAALRIGTYPNDDFIDPLIARCGVEPDFFVRDMLTWSLTRHPAQIVVPKLIAELDRREPQSRSQALHTLSKIGDKAAWPSITDELLHDADDEVARTAWRAAVALVPDQERAALVQELLRQLGRGDRDVQLSLSRAIIALGPHEPDLLAPAMQHANETVRAHAIATERLIQDPDSEFDLAISAADRIHNLGPNHS